MTDSALSPFGVRSVEATGAWPRRMEAAARSGSVERRRRRFICCSEDKLESMRSAATALLCALLSALCALTLACSHEKRAAVVSKEPVSVRGWIADVDTGAPNDRFRTVETESARRTAAFQAMNV